MSTESIASPTADIATATLEDPEQSLGIDGAPHTRTGPVVLALHGGESSHASIIAARLIAERLRAPLRVVTVIEPVPIYSDALDPIPMTFVPWEDLASSQEAAVRKEMRDAMVPDSAWTLQIRRGHPSRLISGYANEVQAAVIVVDAAPRRGLRHAVSGMTALQILRHSSCPVLSVAADFTGLPRRIIAAVDFSPASIHAAETALLLADDDARLTLVHLPSPIHFETAWRDKTGALYGGNVTEAFENARAELQSTASRPALIEAKTVEGSVVDAILSEVGDKNADLISVGTHGPGIVERFFVGSTAASLLHLAHCTVLASPAPSVAEYVRLELRMGDTVTSDEPEKWAQILDSFTLRNAGRHVRLEVDDQAIGAQTQAYGYELHGVTFDPLDHSVSVMVGPDAASRAHLTRRLTNVRSVAITAAAGVDRALRIAAGPTQTLVLFEI